MPTRPVRRRRAHSPCRRMQRLRPRPLIRHRLRRLRRPKHGYVAQAGQAWRESPPPQSTDHTPRNWRWQPQNRAVARLLRRIRWAAQANTLPPADGAKSLMRLGKCVLKRVRRSSKPGASRGTLRQARPGIEPARSWQALRGKCFALHITGCCRPVPQSRAGRAWCGTAPLRSAPFGCAATPVMSCAHSAPAARPAGYSSPRSKA